MNALGIALLVLLGFCSAAPTNAVPTNAPPTLAPTVPTAAPTLPTAAPTAPTASPTAAPTGVQVCTATQWQTAESTSVSGRAPSFCANLRTLAATNKEAGWECNCYAEITAAAAANLNCLLKAGASETVAQRATRCCHADTVRSKLATESTAAKTACTALLENTGNAQIVNVQCPCYNTLPPANATNLFGSTCKIRLTDNFTAITTWSNCNPRQPTMKVTTPLQISTSCGSSINLNVSSWINFNGTDILEYLVTGQPSNTGIKVNTTTGHITGNLSDADCKASPLTISVTAKTSKSSIFESAKRNVTFTLVSKSPTAASVSPTLSPTLPAVVVNQTVSAAVAAAGNTKATTGTLFLYNIASVFANPTNTVPLQYSIASTNSVSKVAINATTGQINALFNASDLALGTIKIVVKASNVNPSGGGVANYTLLINLRPDNYCPELVTNAATFVNACENVRMFVLAKELFQDKDGDAMKITVSNLPSSLGLTYNNVTNELTGIPNEKAAQTGEIRVLFTASDGKCNFTHSVKVFFQQGRRPPVADPPIPSPVTAFRDERFVGYFNFHFRDLAGLPLLYSITGLPAGTGLSLGPNTGILSGAPSAADLRASPLALTIFALNSHNSADPNSHCGGSGGRARADFLLVVESRSMPPVCRPIPQEENTISVGRFYLRNLKQYFGSPSGHDLRYTLKGLPRGSGFSINQFGVVEGYPTQFDLAMTPLNIVISVADQYASCASAYVLNIVGTNAPKPTERPVPTMSPPTLSPPTAAPDLKCAVGSVAIPPQVSYEAESFELNLMPYFSTRDSRFLTFTFSNPPAGTGLSVNPQTGLFAGVPTQTDRLSAGVTGFNVQIRVGCGSGGTPITAFFTLFVQEKVPVCDPCSRANGHGGCQQTCYISDVQKCVSACACQVGWRLNVDGKTCSNNPCNDNNGGCHHICSYNQDRLQCFCENGWTLGADGRSCTPFDPCSVDNGGCQHQCSSQGTAPFLFARCSCTAGFNLNPDGKTCSRGNPCANNNGGCQQICSVNNGNAVCSCAPGFNLNSDQQTCLSDDPCARQNGGCEQLCWNNGGIPTCRCHTGSLAPDSRTCIVDGCVNNGGCEQICTNNMGRPVCQCYSGQLGADAKTCAVDPCTINNGGCEQVCTSISTPFGSSVARCSCRFGDINFDQKTCSSQLVVTGTIPPGLAAGCQSFRFDLATAFRYYGSGAVRYSVIGLPANSGFTISSAGVMQGVATQTDCAQPQPMSLKVIASDGLATAEATMFMSAFCSSTKCNSWSPPSVQTSQAVPVFYAKVCEALKIEVAPYFSRMSSSAFSYRASGFPSASGLSFSSATASITGTPTVQACISSPISVLISALDLAGHNYQLDIHIKFNSCTCVNPQSNLVSTVAPVQPQQQQSYPAVYTQSMYDRPFFYDAAKTFTGFIASYSVRGLPSGSGIKLSPSGVLGGRPNAVDCASNPLSLTVVGTDFFDTSSTLVVNVNVECYGLNAGSHSTVSGVVPITTSANSALPVQKVYLGQRYYFDVSRIALSAAPGQALTFQAIGLVPGSGLVFSPSGVISGSPSQADCAAQPNPLPLRVFAFTGGNVAGSTTIHLNFVCQSSNRPPVLSGTLPVGSGTVGQLFVYDLGHHFSDPDGDSLSFSVTGLSVRSGLRMSATTGILSGILSEADLVQQPLLITAADPKGLVVQGTLGLSIRPAHDNNDDPTFIPLQPVQLIQGRPFAVNILERFVDKNGDSITVDVSGLPAGTGLSYSRETGILQGTPSLVDAAQPQPLRLQLNAHDGRGGRTMVALHIWVTPVVAGMTATSPVSSSATPFPTLPLSPTLNLPPTAMDIPRQLVKEGEAFVFPLGSSFSDQDGDSLTFSVTGLPAGTGIKLDPTTGSMSGTPSRADAQIPQPITVEVIASDGKGGKVSASCLITVLQAENSASSSNRKPVATPLAPLQVTAGRSVALAIGKQFTDPDGDRLQFEVRGLQRGTGLYLDPNTGLLQGVASSIDVANSPLNLMVAAADGQGGVTTLEFSITVSVDGSSSAANNPPLSKPIPAATAYLGRQFELKVSDYFTDRDDDALTYKVFGLPYGTGLFLSPAGFLAGIPTGADVSAQQPIRLGFAADDGRGGRKGEFTTLTIIGDVTAEASASWNVPQDDKDTFSSLTYAVRSAYEIEDQDVLGDLPSSVAVPQVRFETDSWGFFRTSRYFPSYGTQDSDIAIPVIATFSVLGLPPNTGLSIDVASGILKGTPTLADVSAAALKRGGVLPIEVVAAYSVRGQANSVTETKQLLFIEFADSQNPDLARKQAPVATPISPIEISTTDMAVIDLSAAFSDPDGDELHYSVLGLPQQSGFVVIPSSGVFFGQPTIADIRSQQPMQVTVLVEDTQGLQTRTTFSLNVKSSDVGAAEGISRCMELGWPVAKGANTCSGTPLENGKCPPSMDYASATKFCTSQRARLCSSQELASPKLDLRSQNCNADSSRVWTTSNDGCGVGQIKTQAGRWSFLGQIQPRCSPTTRRYRFKCCVDNSVSAHKGQATEQNKPATKVKPTEATCDQLFWPISPSSKKRAICASSKVAPKFVQTISGQKKVGLKCSGPVTFQRAVQLCRSLSARLCTADELSKDTTKGSGCKLDHRAVWTSTPCAAKGKRMTAGASSRATKAKAKCHKASKAVKFPVRCCAGFAQGSEFSVLDKTQTRSTVSLTFKWSAYKVTNVQFALHRFNKQGKKVKTTPADWESPQEGRGIVLEDGQGSLQLKGLEAGSKYSVKITPVILVGAGLTPVKQQSVTTIIQTLP
eukprot:CAMPEP_0175150816 /NCGR_PEP_ID=MMETSP0087-20121206/18107_1 /TAXON_ID=136419 /ORGANISM="Unknown Unknown, Strain D1" /LENGTH=2772 /DNA_ID=CAMNT_0016436857 /DNA_START=154 /DNA_END=8475 /DNA_ORIENTATION=-